MQIRDGFSYDDLLLVPRYSTIKSRSDADTSVTIEKGAFKTVLKHPIIPANMKTVIGYEMAEAIFNAGGLGLVHRFMKFDEQLDILHALEEKYGRSVWNYIGFSVGIKDNDKRYVEKFVDAGAKIICIDVAHGDSEVCIDMTEWVSKSYPDVILISGNVATGSGAVRLWESGADIVKSGIGGGSLCTTRIQTGNGIPMLTALMDVKEAKDKVQEKYPERQFKLIADGGLKNSGDITKALCFADLVMSGNIFAKCEEAPGQVIEMGGIKYKSYVGSSTHKANHVEGVAAWVKCGEKYNEVLGKLLEGVRSGMSYQNAHNLYELKDDPEFVRITNAGLIESHPHDIIMFEKE